MLEVKNGLTFRRTPYWDLWKTPDCFVVPIHRDSSQWHNVRFCVIARHGFQAAAIYYFQVIIFQRSLFCLLTAEFWILFSVFCLFLTPYLASCYKKYKKIKNSYWRLSGLRLLWLSHKRTRCRNRWRLARFVFALLKVNSCTTHIAAKVLLCRQIRKTSAEQ